MTDQKTPCPSGGCEASSSAGGSRRKFLGAATAAMAAALTGCGTISKEEFLQHNFKELSKDEVLSVIDRLEKEYKAKYGKEVKVANTPPIPGVIFGYALDLSRCIGCRRCVYACVKENNQSRDPQIQWIRVLQMDKEEGVNLQHADQYYNPEEVPEEGHFYMPVQCQQCKKPPCTKVCPVGATWREKDGIVVVDYNWCIGCRYCMAACPYGARHFNWGEPNLPADEVNPKTHYLGNRPRPKGVVEKCTFCIQRTRNGRYPACVEICPTGSRKFGNLLDKDSEIRYILENKRVFKFKEDLNTQPNFFYFYGV
ncbi:4Fe-4S dicluster domain-containing protein [Geothrix fuzhouensis]|uniref:4Fe-4S dicluster domain-containing protein n=1 Tax=Geothrix fuzhouensis TaxID=2966451 RepID=UPI002148D200|nr:4Fe-4S dicluster domain-containing protein [Geothrix fuzhouensis]